MSKLCRVTVRWFLKMETKAPRKIMNPAEFWRVFQFCLCSVSLLPNTPFPTTKIKKMTAKNIISLIFSIPPPAYGRYASCGHAGRLSCYICHQKDHLIHIDLVVHYRTFLGPQNSYGLQHILTCEFHSPLVFSLALVMRYFLHILIKMSHLSKSWFLSRKHSIQLCQTIFVTLPPRVKPWISTCNWLVPNYNIELYQWTSSNNISVSFQIQVNCSEAECESC